MDSPEAISQDLITRHYNIHNACRVRLRTDSDFFAFYAGAFLQGFECSSFNGEPDVDAVLYSTPWNSKLDEFLKSGGALISDDAWLKGNELAAVRRGTLYRARYVDNRLEISGWFPEPGILRFVSKVPRRWSRRLGLWESISREEYHLQTMRDLLHYPIFSCLRKKGFTILHGSCVSREGQAVSLFGYNRVGKSSIALAMMVHHGWNPVADNFILTNGERIYAFPERLRYSKSTLSLADADQLSLAGKQECWGKFHFDLPELGRKVEPVTDPVLSCYVVRGNGSPGFRDLAVEEGVLRMGAMNAFLHEFDNFSFLNLLPGFYHFENTALLDRFFRRARVAECVAGRSVRETAQAVVDSLT